MRVDFDSNVHDTLPWGFKPTQKSIKVKHPFPDYLSPYRSCLGRLLLPSTPRPTIRKKPSPELRPTTSSPLVLVPNPSPTLRHSSPGLYFHKIQCFCFEQQRLGPHEEIDMPVFFFIDPEILEDKSMDTTDIITLSYTFFKIDEEDVDSVEGEEVTAGSVTSVAPPSPKAETTK